MTEAASERRRFHRIATDKTVELEIGEQKCIGKVLDISMRGLLIACEPPPNVHEGDKSTARVQLDDVACCIDVEGIVVHINPGQIGLHCTQMDIDSASRLRRLVELNLADSMLLERELVELIADQQH